MHMGVIQYREEIDKARESEYYCSSQVFKYLRGLKSSVQSVATSKDTPSITIRRGDVDTSAVGSGSRLGKLERTHPQTSISLSVCSEVKR